MFQVPILGRAPVIVVAQKLQKVQVVLKHCHLNQVLTVRKETQDQWMISARKVHVLLYSIKKWCITIYLSVVFKYALSKVNIAFIVYSQHLFNSLELLVDGTILCVPAYFSFHDHPRTAKNICIFKQSIPTIRLDKLRFFCMPNTLPVSYAEAGTLVISRSLKSNSWYEVISSHMRTNLFYEKKKGNEDLSYDILCLQNIWSAPLKMRTIDSLQQCRHLLSGCLCCQIMMIIFVIEKWFSNTNNLRYCMLWKNNG